jgi:protein TonB
VPVSRALSVRAAVPVDVRGEWDYRHGKVSGVTLMNSAPRSRVVAITITVLVHGVALYLFAWSQRFIRTTQFEDPVSMVALFLDETRQRPRAAAPVEVRPELKRPALSWAPSVPQFEIEDAPKDPPEVSVDLQIATAPTALSSPAADSPAHSDLSTPIDSATVGSNMAVVQRVVPHYPPLSVRRREEGSVSLRVLVDDRGRVSDVRVEETSGYSRLDESAMHAIRQWVFAPSGLSSRTAGTWGRLELRFSLFSLNFSKLDEAAAQLASVEHTRLGNRESPAPGGEQALRRFIAEVRAANPAREPSPIQQVQMARIKQALARWGAVRLIRFTGSVADAAWRACPVKSEYRAPDSPATVEVRWDLYEVTHAKGTSLWRIAIDRQGMLWSAQVRSRSSS